MIDFSAPLPLPGDLQALPEGTTIVQVLQHRCGVHPDNQAFVFLEDGEKEAGSLTYRELDQGARIVAAKLVSLGLAGKQVLMFYPPGLEFILSFFGCLYARTIPAAAYPPRKNRSVQRVHKIAGDCGAAAILTTENIARSLERNFADDQLLSALPWHPTDLWTIPGQDIHFDNPAGFRDLAFLQYTSGSTGDPKGVMVSHQNIMCNLRSLQLIFSITPEDTAVHWVPQFHDLGLIFGILETVFSGSRAILIPPFIFIGNPFLMLQAITRYQATVSGQPDFAFNHCVEKISDEQRKALDLTTLRVMYSGAEPIRKSTFDRFLETFGPVGLRPESLIPAYGMAESTLILTGAKEPGPTVYLPVSGSELSKNRVVPVADPGQAKDVAWIASNGQPVGDTRILIVDPESGQLQQPGLVGEIWAHGNTVAMGYYGKSALTQSVFKATVTGQEGVYWLRTGDLGFIHNDELYITGRLKDLVIVHGRNFYPQDIEEVAETCHQAIRKSCTAAFAVDMDGKERLAVVAELRRMLFAPDPEEVIDAMVSAISGEFEIQPGRITLVRTGGIIKTSSGKIMRGANREALLQGDFEVIADRTFADQESAKAEIMEGKPATIEEFLMVWCSFRLNQGLAVDPENTLLSYGIDSLRAVELSEEVKRIFGIEWPPYLFFEETSIRQLARDGLK